MSNPKKPLTRSQKREIWVSFWLHAIGVAVFGTLGIVAANVGYLAGLSIPIQSILIGIPTFLVWARFVTKIRKYHESTGIPYPSTYFALAIGSGVLVIGPLLMFLLLLVRMLRVPTLKESDDTGNEGMRPVPVSIQDPIHKAKIRNKPSVKPPESKSEFSDPAEPATCKPAMAPEPASFTIPTDQPKMNPFVVHKQQDDEFKPPKGTIMKYEPEEKQSLSPIIDDEPFYEEVAKEIEADAMKPGLWTKAFAEADGDKEKTKVIYIRQRVAQLMSAKEAELKELKRLEYERFMAEEKARQQAAIEAAARFEAAELERKKEEEVARLEAERQAALIAEKERAEMDPVQIRIKATERFRCEFTNLESFPAKLRINTQYWDEKYNLQIGSEELLFVSPKGRSSDILVSLKLGDQVKVLPIFKGVSESAHIKMADGTLLTVSLGEVSHKALREWRAR